MSRQEILDALRCCRRGDDCGHCPLQGEICDQLFVEMEEIPADLLDKIEKELEVQ